MEKDKKILQIKKFILYGVLASKREDIDLEMIIRWSHGEKYQEFEKLLPMDLLDGIIS